jgi:hypothetical protein
VIGPVSGKNPRELAEITGLGQVKIDASRARPRVIFGGLVRRNGND